MQPATSHRHDFIFQVNGCLLTADDNALHGRDDGRGAAGGLTPAPRDC
jgi:hypothetical protein